jgi:hypothetical protein
MLDHFHAMFLSCSIRSETRKKTLVTFSKTRKKSRENVRLVISRFQAEKMQNESKTPVKGKFTVFSFDRRD